MRERCPRCLRPLSVCYCAHLPQLSPRTRVVVLQHPRERDNPIGTARMASLCLEGSRLLTGVDFAGQPGLAEALGDPARPPCLLYPGEGATDIDHAPPPGPVTLVVIDGTWAHARSLLRHNPWLRGLPRLSFTPRAPSEYRIRREPRDDYVSTIEALAHVLGALEGDPASYASMLAPFRAMVDAQIDHRERLHQSRHHRPSTVTPEERAARRLPPPLRHRPGDLLFVAAEANAWPYRPPSPYPDELIHWLAYRPSTGERFEAILAPRQPLSAGTPTHTRLPAATLAAGLSVDAFLPAWAAFLRPDDVVCAWGLYGLMLLAEAGAPLPPTVVDLRAATTTFLRRSVGTLEACREQFGLADDPPLGQGRGGARLTLAAALGTYLARCANPPAPAPDASEPEATEPEATEPEASAHEAPAPEAPALGAAP